MGADGAQEGRKLSSNAWLRHGPKGLFGPTDPGMLLAIGDRVSFVTKKGPVFEADRSEVKVVWPRSEFGGGVHLSVGGQIYRLALVRPRGAPEFDKTSRENLSQAAREMVADLLWDGSSALTGFGDIHQGRASATDWKAYFGAGAAGTTPERGPATGH